MSMISNVSYSGLNAQNAHRLKDIQRAERAVNLYYNSQGGVTERTSHWHMDDHGNISHFAHVRREDKWNKKLREEAEENAKNLIEKTREKAGAVDKYKISSQTAVQKEGVSYEKTIPDSVSAGLGFIQGLEKQNSGIKFFIGTVSYGQTYGNSSDTNFVINPKFLGKLGTDEAIRKQFEEDVKYLNEFTKRFREQQLARGREIISQGWFCDEHGNWGGWSVSRPVNQSSVLQDMTDNAEKIRQEKLEERKKAEQELKERFGDRFIGFSMKWMEEGVKSEETTEAEAIEDTSEKESVTVSGSVGVNVGKTARKITAAKTTSQLRAVMAEIKGDMQEVKAGMEKGWCDETEMNKVKFLIAMARNRMGQVEDREATPEEETMFAMASLM